MKRINNEQIPGHIPSLLDVPQKMGTIEIEASTLKEAKEKAALMFYERAEIFNHVDFLVITKE